MIFEARAVRRARDRVDGSFGRNREESGVAPCPDHSWHRKVSGCPNVEKRRARRRRAARVERSAHVRTAFSGSRVMNARELLEAGRLSAAIEALNGELKSR